MSRGHPDPLEFLDPLDKNSWRHRCFERSGLRPRSLTHPYRYTWRHEITGLERTKENRSTAVAHCSDVEKAALFQFTLEKSIYKASTEHLCLRILRRSLVNSIADFSYSWSLMSNKLFGGWSIRIGGRIKNLTKKQLDQQHCRG